VEEARQGSPSHHVDKTNEALTGQTLPQPAAFMKRTTQVNVRLTYEEKAMIAAAAKAGFKGLADFIRTTILDRTLFNR
jgi:hypothetical protein